MKNMKEQVLSLEQLAELSDVNMNGVMMRDIIKDNASMLWEFKGSDCEGLSEYYNLEVFDFDDDMLDTGDKPTLTFGDIISLFVKYECDVRTQSIVYSGNKKHIFSIVTPNGDSFTFESDNMMESAFNAVKKGVLLNLFDYKC